MICRSCQGTSLGEVIDLGSMPLANALTDRPMKRCPRWPLRVVFCRDCSLVQLTETPPPEVMFREYCYFSSYSRTMVEHARDLVRRHVAPGQRVLEIASNDGYLLRPAQERGATVLGIDPAANVAAIANAAGIPTRAEFFDRRVARAVRSEWGQADVIFANNVLAHVPDPNEMAGGIARLLAPGGRAHVEVPYMPRMIATGAFDTIYHEHCCYFSVTALDRLFRRHRLRIVGVEPIDIHGGSLHLHLAHEGDDSHARSLIRREQRLGIWDERYYARFARRIRRTRRTLLREIDRFGSVAGYGAAAKAVVMLNSFQIGRSSIPWIADVSPHKQGRHIPGTGQKIVAPSVLIETKPDACVLFPWNIRREIVGRNQEYLRAGGRFIVPIPKVRVL